MNFGGHLMTGWAIANARESSYGERRYLTVMAIAPDIDGFAIAIPSLFEQWHRTFGHNVFFGALVPLSAFLFFGRKDSVRLLPWGYLALASHFLLDLFVTGWWGFYPFWPTSDFMILMSLYIPEWFMKYPLQISIFLLLVGLTIWIYRRTGRTPIEILSPQLDRFVMTFVTTPFRSVCGECEARAFYRCLECGKPVCGRHASFGRRFSTRCPECNSSESLGPQVSNSAQ